jgi:transposase
LSKVDELVLGVDTHKDIHVGVVLEGLGRRLAVAEFVATDAGNGQMIAWACGIGRVSDAGVEGTGSYGHRLACALGAAGIRVWEVSCPDRARRRRKGKSDSVDAENAARAVLAGEATAVPRDRGGIVGQLRSLLLARRSAVKGKTLASNQIKALLLDVDDELRGTLSALRKEHFARACAGLDPTDGTRVAIRTLGQRWLGLDKEARELHGHITTLIRRHAPGLVARSGVGVLSAAQLIVTAGANPSRLSGHAAFAALCGASPVDASSGKTIRRRLNRGGDRAANNALWVVATNRMRHDPRTRAYIEKRTATGNSRKEIARILKRYIARELFPLITAVFSPRTTLPGTA